MPAAARTAAFSGIISPRRFLQDLAQARPIETRDLVAAGMIRPLIIEHRPHVAFRSNSLDLGRTIRLAGVVQGFVMGKNEEERRANERRRETAARIIAGEQKRKKLKQTDEMLLDQEALRRAAIEAGLEKPGDK